MRYNPPESEQMPVDPETGLPQDEVYFEGRPKYVSDQTAFMRWSTEIEQVDHIIDKEFLERNRHRVLDINKILPLSFIDNPKSIQLFRLRRNLSDMAMDAGLQDLVESTILDNLADYQTTRGIRGNYQNALITQRREWRDRSDDEKSRGLFKRLVRNRNEEMNIRDNMAGVY